MMKKGLLVVTIVLQTALLSAQGLNVDSLQDLLRVTKDDTSRVLLLANLSRQFARSKPDTALEVAQQGIALAKKVHYRLGELYCDLSKVIALWSTGDYATAIKLQIADLPEIDQTGDWDLLFNSYASLYSMYRDQGDYAEALKYAYVIRGFDVRHNACSKCRASDIGIAIVYLELKQLDSARLYMQSAFRYPPVKGVDGWIYASAGRIYAALGNNPLALWHYHQSIHAHRAEHNLKDLANTYTYLATLFEQKGSKDSALFYSRQSLQIGSQNKFVKEAMEANLLISELYQGVNLDSSFLYYKQAMVAKDSLYNQEKQRQISAFRFGEETHRREQEIAAQNYRTRVMIYGLTAAAMVLLVIGFLLWRHNQHRKNAYATLERQKAKTEAALNQLKATQQQLIQQEKMASLGELTAGIAHEIQNPLNFVNNFSEANAEMLAELIQEAQHGNIVGVLALAEELEQNQHKITHHGGRADRIVKGMLQHARASTGKKQPTNINKLAEEYLRLSYQGMRAKDKDFSAAIETNLDESIENIPVAQQEIGRVLLNIFNNAFYAVNEKKIQLNGTYEPVVAVITKRETDNIVITVKDNGTGIPQKIMDKVFQPFFTTKPTGEGTGLGLSLSYDIITKGHGGEIKVESREGEGSAFTVKLPA